MGRAVPAGAGPAGVSANSRDAPGARPAPGQYPHRGEDDYAAAKHGRSGGGAPAGIRQGRKTSAFSPSGDRARIRDGNGNTSACVIV